MTVHVYVYENTETTLWFESLVVCEGGPWRLIREYDKEIPDPVGPGGTTDYNQLQNRPQINSVLLSGNKTSKQLRIEGSIPPGGNAGQVLTKKSATDGDADWQTPTGGATSWDQITGKPTDLVQDPAYVHTDNNFTTTEKDQIAANATAIDDRYTKEQTDALLTNKADRSALLALQNQAEDIRLAGEATQAELTEFKGDITIDLGGIVERLDTNETAIADRYTKTETDALFDDKTLTPTGWGVARTGVATVTFNNKRWSTSATVDVSGLGFASGSDYDVVAQPTTGGTATPWGNAIAFVNADKSASSFSVSAVTMEETLSGTVNVKYTIFAKGYGGTHFVDGTGLPTGGVMGQVLAKRSDTDGDVLWKNVNTDSTSVNKANLQGRMVGVYTDDIGGDTTKRFMVMNDSTNKEVAVSFRNAEAELNETAQLYHKDAVDALLENKQDTLESGVNIKTVNGESLLGAGNIAVGVNYEVGAEKWYGTYTENGVTYQVYSKLLDIGPLPSAAGTTQYPHGITGIKQILQINGFTNDGFVMNAPRQNAQDNIAIYQAQKSGNIAVEVGKDRSSKNGFVMLIYAKNN